MTRAKTVYRIKVTDGWMSYLLRELREWREDRYRVEGNVVVTTCKNVVDVATETFMNVPHLITITKAKEAGKNAIIVAPRGLSPSGDRGIDANLLPE